MAVAITEVSAGQSSRRGAIGTQWRLLAGIFLLATSAVLLVLTINSSDLPTSAIKWGGSALAVYICGLLALVSAIRGPGHGLASWRIGPWLLIWVAAMFGLATSTGLGNFQISPSSQVVLSNVLGALWLVAVAMSAWVLGYLIGPGKVATKAVARWTGRLECRFTGDVRSSWAPWLLYGIGGVARATLLLTTARLGYLGNFAPAVTSASWYSHELQSLQSFAPIGVATAVFQLLRRPSRSAQVTAFVLIIAETCYAMISGLKADFIVLIMAVAIPVAAVRGHLPRSILIGCGTVFLVLVIPFSSAYRMNARYGAESISVSQAVSAAPQLLEQTIDGEGNLATTALNSIDYMLGRGLYIADVAIIMQRTPGQIPYLPTAQMITGVGGALIPRALWPGKPIFDPGYEFGQEYFEFSSTEYTSTAVTPMGDLYRYGGWIPVLAGMLFIGLLFRIIDDIIDVRNNPHTIFIPLLTFQALVMAEQDWISTLVAALLFLPFWWLAVSIGFRRRSLN